jgi:hypothetical protein
MERPEKITFGEMRDAGVRGDPGVLRRLSLQPFNRQAIRSTRRTKPSVALATPEAISCAIPAYRARPRCRQLPDASALGSYREREPPQADLSGG